ncbi:DUF968 domain-containing protein [Hymenobacter sp. BT186]|uniref:DUF968 domain-containing protein n=1 Tax=Hymenobacter telluris TaxID=2816474 RepID=A0A939JD73_9BACT|nr:DUF968 domain-containing protein [Hymenobacter telluris]MBO0358603.1 DUF968 domain-containing protein [Hymenobacter telluris]MBW3374629.1 DUF968 domain-containing protein [Hymenobacter norwichensis]
MMFPKPGKKPKKKREGDKGYLLWIASLPCCVCRWWSDTVVAHHSLTSKHKGMATKALDTETIPLCHQHHAALHAHGNETAYLASHGLPDSLTLARAYNEQYGAER